MPETLIAPSPAKTISLDDVLALSPCCNREQIEQLRCYFLHTPRPTALGLLDSELPPDVSLELVLRGGFLSVREVQLLACDFAEAAHPQFKQIFLFDDLLESIEAARAYAMGWCDRWQLDKHFELLNGPDGLIYEVSLRRQRTDGDPAPYHRASDAIAAAIAALEGSAYEARLAAGSALSGPVDWGIELVRQVLRGDQYAS